MNFLKLYEGVLMDSSDCWYGMSAPPFSGPWHIPDIPDILNTDIF